MSRKVYLAGAFNNGASGPLTAQYRAAILAHVDVLESYHYCNDRVVQGICNSGVKIFLDSGAFSSFSKGVEVSITDYAAFIHKYQEHILVASVLDAIGDPEQTLRNQKTLEDLGVDVLPCYHYGEPESYLEHYIENYPYITIGGMVPVSATQLRLWLDRIWTDYLTDEQGRPRVKVHGFGLTTVPLVLAYPWYSVDSSSWIGSAVFGNVMLMLRGKGEIVTFSEESPKNKEFNRHFITLPPKEQEYIASLVEAKGFTVDQLRTEYLARRMVNIEFNKDLAAAPCTFTKHSQPSIF